MSQRLLLAALVALTLAGCKGVRTCNKMKELCSVEADTCDSTRKSVKESFGADGLDRFDDCYLQSTSCAEASGCVAGAAIKGTAEAAKGFLDGLGKELDKKK